jgi:hypothetical protein
VNFFFFFPLPCSQTRRVRARAFVGTYEAKHESYGVLTMLGDGTCGLTMLDGWFEFGVGGARGAIEAPKEAPRVNLPGNAGRPQSHALSDPWGMDAFSIFCLAAEKLI